MNVMTWFTTAHQTKSMGYGKWRCGFRQQAGSWGCA
jgi:hypothetical protein